MRRNAPTLSSLPPSLPPSPPNLEPQSSYIRLADGWGVQLDAKVTAYTLFLLYSLFGSPALRGVADAGSAGDVTARGAAPATRAKLSAGATRNSAAKETVMRRRAKAPWTGISILPTAHAPNLQNVHTARITDRGAPAEQLCSGHPSPPNTRPNAAARTQGPCLSRRRRRHRRHRCCCCCC
jgi:hypothetical protein